MFGFITRNMLTGLITILPIVLTFYLLYWLAYSAEAVLGGFMKGFLPEGMYWPGLGVFVGLIVLFLIGLLMHAYVVQRLFNKLEHLIIHMPIVKPIYSAFRDFLDYFKPKKDQDFEQVVAITFGEMKIVGFITEHECQKLPAGFDDEGSILVYLPLSYMIGGYSVLVPRKSVTVVDMTIDEAMRFTLTAGMTRVDGKHRKSEESVSQEQSVDS